ncbi:MAG: ChbG/HpnK family deacetylase [bacterium]|nr:ChbG/HpnK family deacetylase [bacterium]
MKKFILNADGFGESKDINRAVLECYKYGLLKSVSITPNGDAFDEAVNDIIPNCPEIGVGIHLNITKGKSLCSDLKTLTDENKKFNNSFLMILLKTYLPKNEEFMQEIEREFRNQIEKTMSKTPVSHIDSQEYIHAIPKIFKMVCRLAKEYNIRYVITHHEKPYFVPDAMRHLTLRYLVNFFIHKFLNIINVINEVSLRINKLRTNNYLIGVSYNAMMDSLAVHYGLKDIKAKQTVVEVVIHPKRYEEGQVDGCFGEFILAKNQKLKDKIEGLGYLITNYVKKET